jgi:hypothetical protein
VADWRAIRRGEVSRKGGRPSIFVVEVVHAIYCTGSRLRKTRRVSRGKPFWAYDILGPAISGERQGRFWGREDSRFRGI